MGIDKIKPLVTIGIPTYNRADSLSEAIHSAINQSYQNIEVIISDNASTDNTKTICTQIESKDNRIKYVRQKKNIGSVNNFNAVLS